MPKLIDRIFLREVRKDWPELNTDVMDNDIACEYLRRKLAVDLYIDGASFSSIDERTGFSDSKTIYYVQRCVTVAKDTETMAGYAALLPQNRINRKKAKIEQLFEQYPDLGEYICGVFFGDKKYTKEHNPNVRTVHGLFVQKCREMGIQEYEYPFTTKDHGYNALREYLKKIENEQVEKAIRREGKDQMQKYLSTGFGESYSAHTIAPFDVVQIDGHIIDLLYTIESEGPDGQPNIATATRMWVIAIIDVATRCIIGYSVTPNFNYNQFDVLSAIRNSIMPHEHAPFHLQSLTYPATGGFPSEAIPDSQWACFNTIMLDNAKSHLAEKVVDKLVNNLKCTVNFGSVATPETRGIIERFFGTLERSGFHRLPSTTGSNPRDTKRHSPEKAAARQVIRYEDVCEILEYLIAEYNNSIHSALQNETPLDNMRRKIEQARMPLCIVSPSERIMVQKLTNFTVERKLRGGYSSGSRPRLHYEGATYHAVRIQIPQSMVGQTVYIEVDPSDVSHVKMFWRDGTFFCDMVAEGEWGRIPHSLKTRQIAMAAKNKRNDPDNIFNPNLSKCAEELEERGRKDRRARTKAATMRRESGGALDRPAQSTQILNFPRSQEARPVQKAVGENSCNEMTMTEMNEIIMKYPNDIERAIYEINRIQRERGNRR